MSVYVMPLYSTQKAIALFGNDLSCLIRLNRSSHMAAVTLSSTINAAAES